jgi:hypothetical protein
MQETIESIDERLRHLLAVGPESAPPAAEFEILADSLLGQEFATFSQLVDRADLLRASLHRVGWPRRTPPTRESPYLKAWGKLIKLYTKATQHPAAVPSSPYCALAHERQSWCLLRMMLIFWFELTRVPDTLWGDCTRRCCAPNGPTSPIDASMMSFSARLPASAAAKSTTPPPSSTSQTPMPCPCRCCRG